MSEGPEKIPELSNKIRKQFIQKGLVLLKSTNLTEIPSENQGSIEKWCKMAMNGSMNYEGGANKRNEVGETNLLETGSPGTMNQHYHHEMSQTVNSCEALAFGILDFKGLDKDLENNVGQGQCWLSDSVLITDEILKSELGRKLKEHGLCCIRNFTDATYFDGKVGEWKDWQDLLKTDGRMKHFDKVHYSECLKISFRAN